MSDELAGVALTHLDGELFEGAGATKRDLIGYLDAVADRMVPVLTGRPLSVVRVRPGQPPFVQKNLPKYAPDWIARTTVWSGASHREISYALGDDARTLIWFGNQRAVEFHVTLSRADDPAPTHLVLDLDPPEGADFSAVVATAALVRRALADTGLGGAVKTSGAKGIHVFVPVLPGLSWEDAAAATRALAARAAALDPDVATTAYIVEDREGKVFVDSTRSGGGTVAAAYSPRARPGVPVSFPLGWDDLGAVSPADFTLHTAVAALGSADPWADSMPEPVALPEDLLEDGRAIPVARVAAMHEGKRRKRAARAQDAPGDAPAAP